jgi:hypothetical protein
MVLDGIGASHRHPAHSAEKTVLIYTTLLLLTAAFAGPVPARAVREGLIAEGRTRCRDVRPGMTTEEVRRLLGPYSGATLRVCGGGTPWIEEYRHLGVVVSYGLIGDFDKWRVIRAEWSPAPPRP